ncbi:MAG TPA: hypothetical protein VHP38_01985 [Ruminiclostridium sp.]|nr:hypothetical protein [Ruminiclostridium sp.]
MNGCEDAKSPTVGLVNVNERLKLIYGNNYGLYIDSIPWEGTTVRIIIPELKKEDVAGNAENFSGR